MVNVCLNLIAFSFQIRSHSGFVVVRVTVKSPAEEVLEVTTKSGKSSESEVFPSETAIFFTQNRVWHVFRSETELLNAFSAHLSINVFKFLPKRDSTHLLAFRKLAFSSLLERSFLFW